MAVLEKIRSKAGCLVIVIGVALAAFLLGDVGSWFTSLSQDRQMNSFYVNGEGVKWQDYENRTSQYQERIQQQYQAQGRSLSEAESHQIRNQVFQEMVAEQVMNEESAKIGIDVSPAETFDLVQGNDISPVIIQSGLFNNPETGQFDKAGLLGFLKQLRAGAVTPEEQAMVQQYKGMWLEIEKQVRAFKLSEKYNNLISGAVVTNKLERDKFAQLNGTVADIKYVQQTVDQATDLTVEVTDADIKAYYDKHKELFATTSGGADVDIIYTMITPAESDFAAAREDIIAADEALKAGQNPTLVLDDFSDIPYQDLYFAKSEFNNPIFPADFSSFLDDATVGEVSQIFDSGNTISVAKLIDRKVSPEMLLVRHIVLAPADSYAGQPSKDSLLTVLKANPEAFAEVAAEYSLDQNSSSNGGNLGWLNEAIATSYIGADFSDAIYSAAVGVPFAFNSRYGEHIILVEEARENVSKYKVAFAQRTVTPSSETQAKIFDDMRVFLAENKSGDVATQALNAGYQVLQDIKISATQPQLTQGIENSRSLVRWAMNSKSGEVSDITECGDKYVIAKLNNKFEDAYMPLDFVKNDLKQIVEVEKKVDVMYDKLVAANYTSVDAFASAINRPVDTLSTVKYNSSRLALIGYEPAINAAAALAPANKAIPVKGDRAVYVVDVINRQADTAATALEDAAYLVDAERHGLIRSQALSQVISKSKIQDNRHRFQ